MVVLLRTCSYRRAGTFLGLATYVRLASVAINTIGPYCCANGGNIAGREALNNASKLFFAGDRHSNDDSGMVGDRRLMVDATNVKMPVYQRRFPLLRNENLALTKLQATNGGNHRALVP